MSSVNCNKTHQTSFEVRQYACERRSLADIQMTELPIQEFNCSPPPAKRLDDNSHHNHPPDVTTTTQDTQIQQTMISPSDLEPPPPPRGQPPSNQAGILRQQGAPITPGTMKKRVQIQEISV